MLERIEMGLDDEQPAGAFRNAACAMDRLDQVIKHTEIEHDVEHAARLGKLRRVDLQRLDVAIELRARKIESFLGPEIRVAPGPRVGCDNARRAPPLGGK